jgi:hypothetical protein
MMAESYPGQGPRYVSPPKLTAGQLARARSMAGTDYEIRHMLTAYDAGQLDAAGVLALTEELEG